MCGGMFSPICFSRHGSLICFSVGMVRLRTGDGTDGRASMFGLDEFGFTDLLLIEIFVVGWIYFHHVVLITARASEFVILVFVQCWFFWNYYSDFQFDVTFKKFQFEICTYRHDFVNYYSDFQIDFTSKKIQFGLWIFTVPIELKKDLTNAKKRILLQVWKRLKECYY